MTRRAQLRQSDLTRAALVVKATGVQMSVEAPDGTVYRIAPAGLPIKDDDGLDAWQLRKAQRGNARPV